VRVRVRVRVRVIRRAEMREERGEREGGRKEVCVCMFWRCPRQTRTPHLGCGEKLRTH